MYFQLTMLNVLHTHPCPSHVFVFSEPDIKMHVRTINDPKTQMRGKIIKSEDIFFVSSSSSSKFEEVRLSKKKLKEAEVSAHGILTYAFLASFLAYLGIPKIGPRTYYDVTVTNCARNAHFSTEKHMNKIDTST